MKNIKKLIVLPAILLAFFTGEAQVIKSYSINMHFFPKDAQMWGYPVSNTHFARGNAKITFSEITQDSLVFYLHGEFKIDSVLSGQHSISFDSEKVFYDKDYSYVGLKTMINSQDVKTHRSVVVYYSGFMHPSKARSLSNYMHINKETGVFLRAYHYSPWFPVFENSGEDNYQAEFDNITIKLPAGFRAIVSGKRKHENNDSVNYTVSWQPGVSKIMNLQCTARKFKTISKNGIFVYYINDAAIASSILQYTDTLKTLYNNTFKTQPNSANLHILEMPKYGNISSQNVVGISHSVYKHFDDNLYSRLTIAHELVHPYVAVPVKKSNPFYCFVVEGFPAFFHLYGLHHTSDDFNLEAYMHKIETQYLTKKRTGKSPRGRSLPPEKPILEISHNEIGRYKDKFILPDRSRLFLYDMWQNMGDEKFEVFFNQLFTSDHLEYNSFETLVTRFLPEYKDNLNTWLNTNAYPDEFHLQD